MADSGLSPSFFHRWALTSFLALIVVVLTCKALVCVPFEIFRGEWLSPRAQLLVAWVGFHQDLLFLLLLLPPFALSLAIAGRCTVLSTSLAAGSTLAHLAFTGYTIVAFGYWEIFYTYPNWTALSLSRSYRIFMDHAAAAGVSSSLANLLAIASGVHMLALVSATFRLRAIAPWVSVWGTRGAALLLGIALAGALPDLYPLPACMKTNPILVLVDPRAQVHTDYHIPLNDSEAIPRETDCPSLDSSLVTTRTGSILPAALKTPDIVVVVWESAAARIVMPRPGKSSWLPHLDALSEETVLFEQVYCVLPFTLPSLASLVFAKYPPPVLNNWGVKPADCAVPRLLSNAGYRTACIGATFLPFAGMGQLFVSAGFSRMEDGITHGSGYRRHAWGVDDRMIFDRARVFLNEATDRPAFLMLLTSSTHSPCQSPLPGETKGAIDPAEKEKRAFLFDDKLIAEFYGWLKRRPTGRDSVLLIVGDHGQSFDLNLREKFSESALSEANTHVACLMLHPSRAGLPRRIGTIGSVLDLGPTILELCGLPSHPEHQGRSLFDRGRAEMSVSCLPFLDAEFSLRQDRYAYTVCPTRGIEWLYDVQKDSNGWKNIAVQEPERTRCFRRQLSTWLDRQRALWRAELDQ